MTPPIIQGGQGREPEDLRADARGILWAIGLAVLGLIAALCGGMP